jgi:hypothetical protein
MEQREVTYDSSQVSVFKTHSFVSDKHDFPQIVGKYLFQQLKEWNL